MGRSASCKRWPRSRSPAQRLTCRANRDGERSLLVQSAPRAGDRRATAKQRSVLAGEDPGPVVPNCGKEGPWHFATVGHARTRPLLAARQYRAFAARDRLGISEQLGLLPGEGSGLAGNVLRRDVWRIRHERRAALGSLAAHSRLVHPPDKPAGVRKGEGTRCQSPPADPGRLARPVKESCERRYEGPVPPADPGRLARPVKESCERRHEGPVPPADPGRLARPVKESSERRHEGPVPPQTPAGLPGR